MIKIKPSGDILLICEGRKLSSSDHGWNDLVMKKSSDNGATWTEMKVIYSESKPGENVCIGNPSPIAVNSIPGKVVLVACRDNKEVIVLTTLDSGATWGKPREISKQVMQSNWSWVATGPPQGLELSEGGRLLVAGDHAIDGAGSHWGSHAMFSDDGGINWSISDLMAGGNECQAARVNETSLIMNMRTAIGVRQFSWSHDNGTTWTTPTTTPFETISGKYAGGTCEGSTISIPGRNLLLFSTPFSSSRANMTVFASRDGGHSWSLAQNVDTGPSAYSSLIALNDTHYGLAYETGNYGAITFVPLQLPAT